MDPSTPATLEAALSEIVVLKRMIGVQNHKLMQARHSMVNMQYNIKRIEEWAESGKENNFVRHPERKRKRLDDEVPEECQAGTSTESSGTVQQSFQNDFLEEKLKMLVEEKMKDAEERANFAVEEAERRMQQRLNMAILEESQNHQEVLSSALEEQHQRCRRLALQSFHAAKEMKTGSVADVVAVEPKWEPHCMLCLVNEAMFGREECAHINVCAECSVTLVGEDHRRCLTCQVPCDIFMYFGPNPHP
uniref:RING-type domain-containing protein n=1 Tax=Globodera rostochiensis TaxID=31243 RepID=A0A914H8U5_GLORO